MTAPSSDTEPPSIAADAPHCGVCRHVSFQADWERTPYCVEQDRPVTIRVGEVCPSFATREYVDESAVSSVDEGDSPKLEGNLSLDRTDRKTGREAPFYATYRDDRRYGWLCGNCRTLDVAMDTMGRIECNDCGNTHSPSEWDAAYI